MIECRAWTPFIPNSVNTNGADQMKLSNVLFLFGFLMLIAALAAFTQSKKGVAGEVTLAIVNEQQLTLVSDSLDLQRIPASITNNTNSTIRLVGTDVC